MKDVDKVKIIEEIEKQRIFDVMDDRVSIQDTNFKILYQNRFSKNIFGDRIGKYCYEVYEKNKKTCESCPMAITFKDGKIHTAERNIRTAGGDRILEITASPLRRFNKRIVAGVEVVRDITIRKTKEELELRVKEQTSELNESNTALKVLLKQCEKDRKELENNILSNLKNLILPYITKLKNKLVSKEDIDCLNILNIIESNLKEIVSPFSSRLSSPHLDLTPKEIQVANLLRDGTQDKDIAEILNISIDTVKTHRQNIRKKLGIYGKRVNLRTFLLSQTK